MRHDRRILPETVTENDEKTKDDSSRAAAFYMIKTCGSPDMEGGYENTVLWIAEY